MTLHSSFWLILSKPYALSSNHALGKVKRLLGLKKAGFSGTLDPLATGILPLAFGEALKTMHAMTLTEKEYVFQIRFGEKTTTDDVEGDVLEESSCRPSTKAIQEILSLFTGTITQIPPIYSALKIDGKRSYDLARQGLDVEVKQRDVFIKNLTLLSHDDDHHATFHVTCSTGTYIRSLGRDMSQALGTVGHINRLHRSRVGPFHENMSISLEKLQEITHTHTVQDYTYPLGIGLDDILAVPITQDMYDQCMLGRTVALNTQSDDKKVTLWVEGCFAGFAYLDNGILHPKRMIHLKK